MLEDCPDGIPSVDKGFSQLRGDIGDESGVVMVVSTDDDDDDGEEELLKESQENALEVELREGVGDTDDELGRDTEAAEQAAHAPALEVLASESTER